MESIIVNFYFHMSKIKLLFVNGIGRFFTLCGYMSSDFRLCTLIWDICWIPACRCGGSKPGPRAAI